MAHARVLIVEDDGIIAAHLQDMLLEFGYVVPAPLATGEAALAAVAVQRPDLVVMDIELAGAMDGTTAARHIHDAYDIPVVYLTAHTQANVVEPAKAAAPYGYLVKPVDGRELSVAIEVALHRHALDRQLKASEARFRAILDNIPDLAWLKDRDGRFIAVNQAYATVVGVGTPDGMVGKSDVDFWPTEQAQVFRREDTTVMDSGTELRVEETLLIAGENRSKETHKRPLYDNDGTVVGTVGIAHDVTERKRAEEALRRREREFATLANNSPDLIVRYDSDLRFLYSNPAAQRESGLSLELGRDRRPSELPMPADVARFIEQALGRVLADGAEQRVEQAFPTPGGVRWYETHIVPERDEQGRIESLLAISRDITERKQAEADRLAMERQLLHTQKLESLGVLAGGIAHDFNNLLQAIIGNLELAMMDCVGQPEAQLRMETAMQSGRRAADLTRQMLAYAGRGQFVIAAIDLSALVEENVQMLRTVITHAVTLDVQLARPLPPVRADAGQLQQVVMNLITNASEAIGEQAGTVVIRTGVQDCDADYLRQGRIEETPAPGRFVYLDVTDDGCGMDEATQQRIFDPFFSTKFLGRGLGMAAVLGIVRGHQGTIILTSQVGLGTTVRVLLPATAPAPGDPAAATQTTHRRPSPLPGAERAGTVLVVDDEDDVRRLVAQWLQVMGFTVLTAADGIEAVQIIQQHATETTCVVLDLTMPGQDGVTTCAQLHQICPDIKVILSSGYPAEEALRRFAGQGVDGFVHKPFRLNELGAEITRVLRLA